MTTRHRRYRVHHQTVDGNTCLSDDACPANVTLCHVLPANLATQNMRGHRGGPVMGRRQQKEVSLRVVISGHDILIAPVMIRIPPT
jgi:hypothetical protein